MTASRRRTAAELGVVLAAFALAGAVAGFVWERLWTPAMGVVVDHRWRPADALALQQQFSGTGWYVVVGTAVGLLLGIVATLLVDRVPLLTLVAVVVGSALAAWVMLRVGVALGPADPQDLAASADEGTRLPAQLQVSGRSPFIAFPLGALVGLVIVLIGLGPRHHHAPVEEHPEATPTP
jgi:hypothetical protein